MPSSSSGARTSRRACSSTAWGRRCAPPPMGWAWRWCSIRWSTARSDPARWCAWARPCRRAATSGSPAGRTSAGCRPSAPCAVGCCTSCRRAECHSGRRAPVAFAAAPDWIETSAMDLMLPARDGVGLAATLFDPETPNGAALLLNSGTGIPRQFYAAFAQHLAGRGFAVMTYDYRGVGGSQTSPSATVEQWGSVDQASMIDHLARLRPGRLLGLIGHSFGGQVLGLAGNVAKLDAAVLVCSQSGHWR